MGNHKNEQEQIVSFFGIDNYEGNIRTKKEQRKFDSKKDKWTINKILWRRQYNRSYEEKYNKMLLRDVFEQRWSDRAKEDDRSREKMEREKQRNFVIASMDHLNGF